MNLTGFKRRVVRNLLECPCIRWRCWRKWRLLVTIGVIVLYMLILLVVLPLMVVGLYAVHAQAQFSAWFVAAVFVLLTIPIFIANLLQHLFNYTKPHLQAYIMRILWIVPVYSIDSWLGLKFPATAIYWSTVRECYESYALYNFLVYLLNFLTEEYMLADIMETRLPVIHPIPCCCCKPWPKGMRFIKWCKVAVLQYAVARPVLTILALIFQWAGVYDEGHIRPDRMYVYIAIANGTSQSLALYSLFYFYKGLRDLLQPMKPVLKFGAIKLIIVVTFWQSFIISVLVKFDVIQQSLTWDKHGFSDVAISIQDFLICIEMLVAAIGFYFIFSHKPYIDPAATQIPCIQSFIEMIDVRDIYGDVRENFVDPIPVPGLPRRWRRPPGESQEEIPLINMPRAGSVGGYESGEENGPIIERQHGEGIAASRPDRPSGVRPERLGSGEASLEIYSIRDQPVQVMREDQFDMVSSSDNGSVDGSVRERKSNVTTSTSSSSNDSSSSPSK